MKLVFDKDILVNAVEQNCVVISGKAVTAALFNILIRIKDKKCYFITTDLVDTMITQVDVISCEEDGEFLINGKNILTVLKTLTSDRITFDVQENTIVVSSGSFNAKLNKQDSNEFPTIEIIDIDSGMKFKTSELVNALNFVLPTVATDQTRPVFCGISLNYAVENNQAVVTLCSTDGHRLSKTTVLATENKSESTEQANYIIPANIAQIISKFFTKEDEVILCLNNTTATVKSSKTIIKTQLINGAFPDFTKVIPDSQFNIIINKKDFSNSLKRSLAFNTKLPSSKLEFTNKQLTIITTDNVLGVMTDVIECNYEGDNLDLGVNTRYLEQAINVVDDSFVCLGVIDGDTPIKIVSESDFNAKDESQMAIIMPMCV